ncbi:MAG: HAD-IIIA family hydrolase [Alcanivoracaceae bacterium]
MTAYRLVIFDWDGTVMDSTGRIVACMESAARDVGLPPLAPVQIRHIIGLGLPEAIAVLYPQAPVAQRLAMKDRYAHHFIEAEHSPSPLFPHVHDVLQRLREHGLHLAVATGKSRKGLERVWRNTGYGALFDASRCADESLSKPHPAMVHELLAHFAVPPEQALVVGDTTHDLNMAHNAGVASVAVSYGAHDHAVLAKCAPLAMIESMAQLMPVLGLQQLEIA